MSGISSEVESDVSEIFVVFSVDVVSSDSPGEVSHIKLLFGLFLVVLLSENVDNLKEVVYHTDENSCIDVLDFSQLRDLMLLKIIHTLYICFCTPWTSRLYTKRM